MSQKEKTPSLPVSEEITPEMLDELSNGKGDEDEQQ